jgi:peptidoglycan/LPS O-acetylase OafA/YrhL
MTAVDWAYLGAHFLWIFGASLILAAFSYHVWLAQETGRPISAELREPSWRLALNIGLSLIVVTITVMPRSERWWTRLTALIIAFGFACLALRALRKPRA